MSSPWARAGMCSLCLVGAMALPRAASGYYCTQAVDSSGEEAGPSLSWFQRSIPFTFYAAGTSQIADEAELVTLTQSFAVWNGIQGCAAPTQQSDIEFHQTASRSSVDRIGYDFTRPSANENLVIFRDEGWPIPGQEDVIALTTTTYAPLTGEIVDADIEINSGTFVFAVDGDDRHMDLMNTVVHEIGHVLGLGHSTVADSTMEAYGAVGETKKRTLECDERDAIVFKYPSAEPNGYCATTDTCSNRCKPPQELTVWPRVSVQGSDDGKGGCDCGSSKPSLAQSGLFVLALALWRWSMRKPRVCADE